MGFPGSMKPLRARGRGVEAGAGLVDARAVSDARNPGPTPDDRIHFTGCDYFRFARHPAVVAAYRRAALEVGTNVAASRRTTGNHPWYASFEEALAEFLGVESTVLVGSGYLANLVVAEVLAGDVGSVLIEARAHPSLQDAARSLRRPTDTFPAGDAGMLRKHLARRRRHGRRLVLTDGVFPIEGRVAPLADYLLVLPEDAWLLVDDAHGMGVLGDRGEGTPFECGVGADPRVLRTGTLSKAFGAFGGVVAGPGWLVRRIVEQSRMFGGSTPPPLPGVAAAKESIRLLREDARWLGRLRANGLALKSAFRQLGIAGLDNRVPILSLPCCSEGEADRLEEALLAEGVFPSRVTYPGGPELPTFRFAVSSEHRTHELDRLVRAVRCGWGKARGENPDARILATDQTR